MKYSNILINLEETYLKITLITGADIADEGGEAGRRLAALSGIHQRGNYPTD